MKGQRYIHKQWDIEINYIPGDKTLLIVNNMPEDCIGADILYDHYNFSIQSIDCIELTDRRIYLPGKIDGKNLPCIYVRKESADLFLRKKEALDSFFKSMGWGKEKKSYHPGWW